MFRSAAVAVTARFSTLGNAREVRAKLNIVRSFAANYAGRETALREGFEMNTFETAATEDAYNLLWELLDRRPTKDELAYVMTPNEDS